MKFRAQVELGGKSATGIAVPGEVIAALAAGKRPAVRVTVGGHAYRTTVAPMGGQFDVSLSAENRRAAGVATGEMVDVDIELDTQPRELALRATSKRRFRTTARRARSSRSCRTRTARSGCNGSRMPGSRDTLDAAGTHARGAQGPAAHALARGCAVRVRGRGRKDA